jgi:uncharacterized cupin superfamily protein
MKGMVAEPMKIKVEKPSAEAEAALKSCPTWSCDAGSFEWYYDQAETCLLLTGEVRVTTSDGEAVTFGAGDQVTFPAGLRCTWDVGKAVRKHFRFD